ncbi:uncharacterized protein LTR77_003098 [Saxophila tyrrhenica]|uniref:SPX domain-containing protein n=1 Tax=Saxophila tyrrhenica TaxID=1690608 RepID=A0AAV9PGZ3_9PEZI|nr:hypothetical protein LTR77_003098 [Saxophila tyrrhenica]
MKFGQEYQRVLATQDFPEQWRESAIEYKHLKKCIKKIHQELQSLGLDADTLRQMSEWVGESQAEQNDSKGYYSAATPSLASVPEEFTPQLRVLVDKRTGMPLDATLAPDTKSALQKLAKHEMMSAGRRDYLGASTPSNHAVRKSSVVGDTMEGTIMEAEDARWVQVPLASAKDFFDLLEPKLQDLEILRTAETEKLEEDILDLGDAVENVVQPVREGYEATRKLSYRDLYFWREMFRLYTENPIFYSGTESRRGALTFNEAKSRLQAYDAQLREIGLLEKMKTPQAKRAAQQFLDLNVNILRIMHFQEMNARAMTKILKKFDKRTHLEGQLFLKNLRTKYPALLTNSGKQSQMQSAGGFANSIARDLSAEIATKVLAIVPQPEDWDCPVCYSMAWRPVSLGCCRSVFCIRCIIKLQDEGMKRCPVCNQESVMKADGRNIDFEAMDFLQKYFPMETKKRQKENEKAALVRDYGEGFVKSGCAMQ